MNPIRKAGARADLFVVVGETRCLKKNEKRDELSTILFETTPVQILN